MVEDLLRAYEGEVTRAASSYFAWKSFNNIAAAEKRVLDALQANALSWNTIAYSLQVTFFVTLGRIFDRDARSLTVHRFIAGCRAHIDEVTRRDLERRRLATSVGGRPEWLDEYLRDMYEAQPGDFDALVAAVKPYEATYRTNYEPIRHKVIAHKDYATIGSSDALFAKTNIGEVEQLLSLLHQVGRVVGELYRNGRATSLHDHTLQEERYVREDLEALLRQFAGIR